MSKYTQKEETEIVKDALTLTNAIEIETHELSKQKSKQFKPKPKAPTHETIEVPTVEVQMPQAPKTNYTFGEYLRDNILYLVISLFCWPFIFYALFQFSKKKNEINEELKLSPKYQNAVAEAENNAKLEQQKINDEIAKQQNEIDNKYNADLEHYNTVIIPNYNKEFDIWKISQKTKISLLENEIQFNKETLNALYEATGLISSRYRNSEWLMWLYEDMSTSDHDIARAIDLTNVERQINATKQVGEKIKNSIDSMHASMMSGFNAVYSAIDEGNEELIKTRRAQNLANTTGIIQRYNLNKMMKSQQEILENHFN